jgi:hypothetical protein
MFSDWDESHVRSPAFNAPFAFTFAPGRKPGDSNIREVILVRRAIHGTEDAETVLNSDYDKPSVALVDDIFPVVGAGLAREVSV